MKQSAYAQKRRRGLVPHLYNEQSDSYRRGAWKNWPKHTSDAERASMAGRDVQAHPIRHSSGHQFTDKADLSWIARDTDFSWMRSIRPLTPKEAPRG